MPWVRFTGDFDFKPKTSVTQAFRAGSVKLVTTACAKAAVTAGRAENTRKPKAGHDA